MNQATTALLATIRDAFPPLPIVASGAFDQRGITYPDAVEYCNRMDGNTWEELDPEFFARRSDGLSFLGDRHLSEVLPAYLKLMFVMGPRSPIPETLLPLLTKTAASSKRFEQRISGLSHRQKRVVAAALNHFVELFPAYAPPARAALDQYWSGLGESH